MIKIIKSDTRKDFKEHNIETNFTFLPSIVYQRQTGGERFVAFNWLWLALAVELPKHKETITMKWVAEK